MTAAERLRAMAQGRGHCVVPRGVLRDIAAQVEKEVARPVCKMTMCLGEQGFEWGCSACGRVTATGIKRPRYCCWCGAEMVG